MNGLLIDITKCVGCNACRDACAVKNGLPASTSTNVYADPLSASLFTVVEQRGDLFVRRMCMHCADPTCASVCPVGALTKTALGPVTYDPDKCMGCRYCMAACPFGVPKYEWSAVWPKVRKCDLCADRLAAGKATACADACPTGATLFGERNELIAEARRRQAETPSAYTAQIYGLNEVGGTSVMYLAPKPFDQLGFRNDLQTEALPLLTYRVLSKIPQLASMGGFLLGGVWWLTRRRQEVARTEGDKS